MTNRECDVALPLYHVTLTIGDPLKAIGLGVGGCRKVEVLDHLFIDDVATTPTINDHAQGSRLDQTPRMEKIFTLVSQTSFLT